MVLQIAAKWSQPIVLRLASPGSGEIYESAFLENVPEEGGVYVFGRSFGKDKRPLYIGQAKNLKGRLVKQFNNAYLMTHIRDAENGGRFLIYAVPKLKPKQKLVPVITVMENALIALALSEGIQLLQKLGTKRPNHVIRFTGNRTSRKFAPPLMRVAAPPIKATSRPSARS